MGGTAHPGCILFIRKSSILYHTLWESVHVFFESAGSWAMPSAVRLSLSVFGAGKTGAEPDVPDEVQRTRSSEGSERLRTPGRGGPRGRRADQRHGQSRSGWGGAASILLGNGGSATDANDWAIDCIVPPTGYRPVPAVSLSLEPANVQAVANDVGTEAIFLRQLIAHGSGGRGRRHFHQRRVARRHRRAGGGAQA